MLEEVGPNACLEAHILEDPRQGGEDNRRLIFPLLPRLLNLTPLERTLDLA